MILMSLDGSPGYVCPSTWVQTALHVFCAGRCVDRFEPINTPFRSFRSKINFSLSHHAVQCCMTNPADLQCNRSASRRKSHPLCILCSKITTELAALLAYYNRISVPQLFPTMHRYEARNGASKPFQTEGTLCK
jgi:hypothetical protein